jgi:diguanylate cyclase (GGDEF)-like protein
MLVLSGVLAMVVAAASALIGWARVRRHMVELTHENARLSAEVELDPLTGLANRRGILRSLDMALARPRALTAVLYVDLDNFKSVNDGHGHRCGDRALVEVADRLTRVLPPGACAGRIGGDELVVVLPAAGSLAEATRVAGVIRDHLARPIEIDLIPDELIVTASIGVAVARTGNLAEPGAREAVLEAANSALRRAKAAGRDRVMAMHPG